MSQVMLSYGQLIQLIYQRNSEVKEQIKRVEIVLTQQLHTLERRFDERLSRIEESIAFLARQVGRTLGKHKTDEDE